MLSSYQRSRILLWTGVIVCTLIFWIGGAYFDVPLLPREAGSLLAQPAPVTSTMIAGILLLACVIVASAIAGSQQFEAGLMCATVGLAALSMRAGPMRETLFLANGPAIYLRLAVELAILFAFVAAGFLIVVALGQVRFVKHELPVSDSDDVDEPLDQRLLALLTHVVVMAMLMMLLCQSDDKAQVLASVGVSSILAALAAHQFVATRPSTWFFAGPLVVGVAGYLLTYFGGAPGWKVGQVRGMFAPLARPLPLDYASFGTAGAIIGYWTSRRWHRGRMLAENAVDAA